MNNNRKTPTEKEMFEQLRSGKVVLPPLSFRIMKEEPELEGDRRFDALIEASWRKKSAIFAVECKASSTPKAFQDGVSMLKSSSLPQGYRPLLFLPFLSEKQMQELEEEGISGIDLCNNGVVAVPGSFAVFRSGGKNRFSSSAPIKNIYRKNSSMAGRVFFRRAGYATVQEIWVEINRRNLLVNLANKKSMSLSTVSKVLKTLEEDLIIARKETICLLQPDKLLEKLERNYCPPTIKEKVRLKVPEEGRMLQELLVNLSQAIDLPIVATGMSSATQYAVMQRGNVLSVYCPRLENLLKRLPGNKTERFPNLELLETDDETVYFDARQKGDFWWASPVQVYLELMSGDKRDQETAEQVKSFLLKNLESVRQ